jgi:hypothetical protein
MSTFGSQHAFPKAAGMSVRHALTSGVDYSCQAPMSCLCCRRSRSIGAGARGVAAGVVGDRTQRLPQGGGLLIGESVRLGQLDRQVLPPGAELRTLLG